MWRDDLRKNLPAVKKSIFNDLHMQLATQATHDKSNVQFITIAPQKDRKGEQMKISVTFTVEIRWKIRCFIDMTDHCIVTAGVGNGMYENIFNEQEVQLPWKITHVKPQYPFDGSQKLRHPMKRFVERRYIFLP